MLKKLFIPHHGNKFQPHILHHKRVWFYGSFLALLKVMVVATILLAPEQAWLSGDALARQTDNIISLTNELRLDNNLPILKENILLDNSAKLKAGDMAKNNYFSHTDTQGRGLEYFLQQVGYKYNFAGENLAIGYVDASSVMRAWKKSPTHYGNIIDGDFKELGISIVSGEYQNKPTAFIVSHFGAPTVNAKEVGSISSVAGVKVESPTKSQLILDKYFSAKNTFSDWFYGEFEFTRYIYLIFFFVFAIALSLTILIERKRQHPHLVANGLGILALIFLLIKI